MVLRGFGEKECRKGTQGVLGWRVVAVRDD